jgi:hypothetical protein
VPLARPLAKERPNGLFGLGLDLPPFRDHARTHAPTSRVLELSDLPQIIGIVLFTHATKRR